METLEYRAAMSAPHSEENKVSYPEKGMIVLRALKTKTQQGLKARPCEDYTGHVYTGQGPTGHYETLSEELKKELSYIITPRTEVVLSDGKVFDLDNNPIDVANWKWLRRHPYIAMSKRQCEASRDARFYVDDPKQEAERRVVTSRAKDKARYIIQYTASRDQLVKAAFLLGNLGADQMELSVLQDTLLQHADTMAAITLDALEPSNAERTNAKLLLVDLIKRRLVQRGDGGFFRFGGASGMSLGHTEEVVIDFMLDDKNAEAVQMMESALIQAKHLS